MNSFSWTLQHRVAWLIVSLTGAVAGVLLARYIHRPDPSEILNITNPAIFPDFGRFSTRRSSSSFLPEFDRSDVFRLIYGW